ncbi:MAG TPA: threonine synthase [Bacilli bacterium]|nr:threonine synthase [Bacilli bacterium]
MYKSTRGNKETKLIPASLAIIKGIASDGGLFIYDQLPHVQINSLVGVTYHQLAKKIIKLLLDDFSEAEVSEIIDSAYDNKFDTSEIVRLVDSKDCFFLELFHGKTLAFKDMALSVLPLLLTKAKMKQGILGKTIILTATSGDTGSAALSGFHKQKDIDVVVLYPNSGVSWIQEQQMLSFQGENSHVVAVDGNFDEAQRLVKKAFTDESLAKYPLSSANSINIGRLIPQIVYYFYGYLELVRKKQIALGEQINFVVPTGNFGNILAGYMAKKMGVPIKKLICASNENNVLTDFFQEGLYNRNRPFIKTSSPSMDILISSNLERLLYYISNHDANKVKDLMNQLSTTGKYQIDEDMRKNLTDFYGGFATENEMKEAIVDVYQKDHYLLDTHTAVAKAVYKKYCQETQDQTKTIITATAHPFKFPVALCKALSIDNKGSNDLELIKALATKTGMAIPPVLLSLNHEQKRLLWLKKDCYQQLTKLLGELYEKN